MLALALRAIGRAPLGTRTLGHPGSSACVLRSRGPSACVLGGHAGAALGYRALHASCPRAQWRATSHIVCTPPRVKVSYGERLVHMIVMFLIWTTPIAYFHTQIKVWRREYGSDDAAQD